MVSLDLDVFMYYYIIVVVISVMIIYQSNYVHVAVAGGMMIAASYSLVKEGFFFDSDVSKGKIDRYLSCIIHFIHSFTLIYL